MAFVLVLGLGLPWWLSRRKTGAQPPSDHGGQPRRFPPSSLLQVLAILFIAHGVYAIVNTATQMGPFQFIINPGVLSLPIGVGLWRRREFWRKCAVASVWLGLGLWLMSVSALFTPLQGAWRRAHFIVIPGEHAVTGTGAAVWGLTLLLGTAALLVWTLRTLGRPDFKALFQSPPMRRTGWLEIGLTAAVACLPLLNGWNFVAMRLGAEFPKGPFGQRLNRLMMQRQMEANAQPTVMRTQAAGPFIAQLDHCTVELVAISHPPLTNTACWLPTGELSPEPFPKKEGSSDNYNNSPQERILAFRVTNVGTNGISQPVVRVQNAPGLMPQASTWQPPHTAAPFGTFFQNLANPDATQPLSPTVDISVGIANGAWETALSEGHRQATNAKRTRSDPATGNWALSFQANPLRNGDMGVTCTYSKKSDWETRMVVVNAQGQTTVLSENTTNSAEDQSTAFLDVSAEEFASIKEFRLERRPRQWAQFCQVSLIPKRHSVVTIVPAEVANGPKASATPPSELPNPAAIAEIEKEVASEDRKNGNGSPAAIHPVANTSPKESNYLKFEAGPGVQLQYDVAEKKLTATANPGASGVRVIRKSVEDLQAPAKAFLASRMKLDFSAPVDREQLKVVAEDLAVAERQLQVGVVSPLEYAMIKLTNEVMLAHAKGQYNEAAQLWLDTKAKELVALKNKSQVGVIPPDEYECARLDYESAKAEAAGQDGLAAWFQFRRASLEYGVAEHMSAVGMSTTASATRAKLALKRAAAVPALRAEPPQLCFVAWQEAWQKTQSVAARHPDGSTIKTDEERDWLKSLNPARVDLSKLKLTPQPRVAHLWIAHPLFDDSSVVSLEPVDADGQVIPDGAQGHQTGSYSQPGRGNGFCGWTLRTFAPSETKPLNLRLRYAVGPLERTNTLRVAESTRLNMTLEGDCGINGVGQNAEGQAFIALSYLPARLGARQYQAVAIKKNGEELRATDTSLSGLDGEGLCLAKFTFNVPLEKLEAFTIGTRPVRTQVWSNVVLP